MVRENLELDAFVDRLRHVRFWIFDLDNTLYHPQSGVLDQMHERTRQFLRQHCGLPEDQADEVRRDYLARYGTTLAGLMQERGLHPSVFLDYVHDIDLAVLSRDSMLEEALARLPGRKIIFTNGPKVHAERVLDRLGLDRSFDAIFDIAAAGYKPKPNPLAFDRFFAAHVCEPSTSVMFDDQARNLVYPHELGMACVLVGPAPSNALTHVHASVEHPSVMLAALGSKL